MTKAPDTDSLSGVQSMSSLEVRAKEAAAARERLQIALLTCASEVTKAAEAMMVSGVELARAAEREQTATLAYVTELERRLSIQSAVS